MNVVFTFQTEGRYNPNRKIVQSRYSCFYLSNRRQIQQMLYWLTITSGCFYLSNRRQIQPSFKPNFAFVVVFTFQTEGRYNFSRRQYVPSSVVFTFQTEGRYNDEHVIGQDMAVVFTFQTEGRYNK